MFHLAAWSKLIDNTANTDVTPVTDDILPIQNSHFVLPQDMQLVAAWAASATLSRARLNSGSLRQVNPPYFRPLNVAALPANDPNLVELAHRPFTLKGQEELILEATSGVAMGTERSTFLAWMMPNFDPAPQGDTYFIRFTSTTAAVANVWTTLAVTFETSLPKGRYAAVGCELQSTNGQAHRLIFDNQIWRPGFLSISSLGNRTHVYDYRQTLGKWGEFTTVSLPRFQVLVNGTDAAHEGYLQCVRLPGF